MTLEKALASAPAHFPVALTMTAENTVQLDLSKSNRDPAFQAIHNIADFEKYLSAFLQNHRKEYGIGGYGEHRAIYQRFKHFKSDQAPERDHHLGIDLWCPAHTPVIAPLDGKIHSLANNATLGDYGGTLILEHRLGEHDFFSLYGHLDPISIERWSSGTPVKAGDQIGLLGNVAVNVGWPPHLHFQIICDLKGKRGDFPGVVAEEDRAEALANCPDPNLLLRFDGLIQ